MAGQTEYVRKSWIDDFQTQIEVGQSVAVHWPGTRFDSGAQKEWFRVVDLGFTPDLGNGGTRVERWTFQVDALARVGSEHTGDSIYRLDQLVDMVVETYRYREVTVVDWSQPDPKPTFGTLTFLQPEIDPAPDPEVDGDRAVVTLPAVFEKFS